MKNTFLSDSFIEICTVVSLLYRCKANTFQVHRTLIVGPAPFVWFQKKPLKLCTTLFFMYLGHISNLKVRKLKQE